VIDHNKDNDILLIVDFQNDFVTGSLAVKGALNLTPKIKSYIDKFRHVIFSIDWHPERHCSFIDRGGTWPEHCIQNTEGSEIYDEILKHTKQGFVTFPKGYVIGKEDYSVFANPNFVDYFIDWLMYNPKEKKGIYVCGLATDYCVKSTVLDACKLVHPVASNRVTVYLLTDAIAAVNVKEYDGLKAISEMSKACALPIVFSDIKWEE
jgi:nicotinamidase/pyrazinamidase